MMKGLSQGLARSGAKLRDKLNANPKAAALLRDLLAAARKTAADPKRLSAERAEAIRTLALGSFPDSRDLLAGLLTGQQPQAVQLAAVAALDAFPDPQVALILTEAWPRLTPRVRTAASDALYARPDRIAALLDATDKGRIPLSDLDPARLKLAESNAPGAPLRDRIKAALAKIQLGRRQDVVDAYKGALSLKGDPAKGKQLFQKTCTACHRLQNTGNEIGPNLASMQSRGPEAILVNVLDPNREVNPQYIEYVVTTRDGRTLTGLLAAETATSVSLKRGEGASDTVLRGDIETMRSTGLSLMPEGLEKQLDQQGIADLIAYVMAVK
jgi:putative heme-binding domain-containing protein